MFNVRYPNMNNAVLNVYPSTPVNRLANVEQVTFEVGDRTGALFDFSTQADLAAKDIYKFKDYKVVEADGGSGRFKSIRTLTKLMLLSSIRLWLRLTTKLLVV